jgi:hypothetical protein
MAVIEDYLAKQKHALHIALTGVGDNTEAMSVLGTLGIKGIGQLKHYALNYGQETLMEIAYIDTGRYTQTSKTLWANGTAMIVQTQARMYMVSKHYQPGMAVSMKEVRMLHLSRKDVHWLYTHQKADTRSYRKAYCSACHTWQASARSHSKRETSCTQMTGSTATTIAYR